MFEIVINQVDSCGVCPLYVVVHGHTDTCRYPVRLKPEDADEDFGDIRDGRFPEKCPLRRGRLILWKSEDDAKKKEA